MEKSDDHKLQAAPEAQVPEWLLDLLLGLAVTLVLTLVISSQQGGTRAPDLLAYLFAVCFGSFMLLRRRFPVIILVATMLLLFVYYIFNYPAIGLALPVVAALYSAAERGHIRATIVVSIVLICVSTYFRLRDGESIAYLLGYELASTATLLAASIALGDSSRSRKALRAEQAHTAQLIAQEHAYRAEQRIQSERVRMARELHDTLGHSISIISLQADVARESLNSKPDQALQALGHIRTACSATMRELRTLLKVLRTPSDQQANWSIGSLSHLAELITNASNSGLEIDAQIDNQLKIERLPASIDAAAYRIIQEALTNSLRHAHASKLWLRINSVDAGLQIDIVDNGKSGQGPVTEGSGISGMRERARLLGGDLRAEAIPTGGFEVKAFLPLKEL
jgi:signal transduction histidine kinase